VDGVTLAGADLASVVRYLAAKAGATVNRHEYGFIIGQ
jgi:hypothetical protein